MKQRKKHLFADCTGFEWRTPDDVRRQNTTTEVSSVTCGTCKGRVLETIRAKDWRDLSPTETYLLKQACEDVLRRQATDEER